MTYDSNIAEYIWDHERPDRTVTMPRHGNKYALFVLGENQLERVKQHTGEWADTAVVILVYDRSVDHVFAMWLLSIGTGDELMDKLKLIKGKGR